jgi:cob(I)alamin adenosyltransferase
MRGYTQVYTGDGKGKTTAALGLTMRAAGAGLRVYIGQFIKGKPTSELAVIRERFPEVTMEQYGLGGFITAEPSQGDIDAAREGMASIRDAILGGKYDVVIADEINNAASLGLIGADDVVSLIDNKPDTVELVLTGRSAHESVICRADLVTEMKNIKHYMDDGVEARNGIEK